MLYKEFYSELGKLLYAIADSDGVITKQERTALLELVKKELVPNENSIDEFGTDAAFYPEFEFDIMDDAITEPKVAFESFINFMEMHRKAIDKKLIKIALKVATKIADSYYQTNKKEHDLINMLKNKLNHLL